MGRTQMTSAMMTYPCGLLWVSNTCTRWFRVLCCTVNGIAGYALRSLINCFCSVRNICWFRDRHSSCGATIALFRSVGAARRRRGVLREAPVERLARIGSHPEADGFSRQGRSCKIHSRLVVEAPFHMLSHALLLRLCHGRRRPLKQRRLPRREDLSACSKGKSNRSNP